jgi:outer membrane biosynthesis protein TonB
MEKDSLKKGYKSRNGGNQDAVSYFTGSSGGDWLKSLDNKPQAKPQPQSQPQAKPQPKKSEAPAPAPAPAPKNNPERDALLSAFNEKYGVLNLKGKEYDETLARFSKKWNADKQEYGKAEPRKDSKKDSNWLSELIAYGSRDHSRK